jgi:hypothetical protein
VFSFTEQLSVQAHFIREIVGSILAADSCKHLCEESRSTSTESPWFCPATQVFFYVA